MFLAQLFELRESWEVRETVSALLLERRKSRNIQWTFLA